MIKNFKEYCTIALNSWLPTMLLVCIIFGIVDSTVSHQYDTAGILVIALSIMFSFIFIVFAVKINELQKEIQEINKTINNIEKGNYTVIE